MSADQNISSTRWCLPATLLQAALVVVFCSVPCYSQPSVDKSEKLEISSAFESQIIKLSVKPGEVTLPAEWKYTNHWDFPLVVERFDTSCGCLSGNLDQSPIAPGKSGTLRASFDPGNNRGLVRKSLHVRFVGHATPVELVAEATIPSHVELSQQELIWKANEKPEAKTIDFTSGTGKPFAITDLLGVPENQFTITRETISEGSSYRLTLVPTASATGLHCLQIRTDSPDPRDRVRVLFLNVETAPASSPKS
jgi:hypothetical protein